MSAENVQVVRDVYAAFARKDIDAIVAALDEDVAWTTSMLLRSGATYHGHDGVRSLLGALGEVWQEMSAEPEEFIDGGENVVALGRIQGQTRKAAAPVNVPFAHVWTVRDGYLQRLRAFTDTALLARALAED